jgi:hypothetical protein
MINPTSPDIVAVPDGMCLLAKEFGARRGPAPDAEKRDPRVQLGVALERMYAAMNELHAGDPLSVRHVWSHDGDVALVSPDGVVATWDAVRAELDRQARQRAGWQVVAEEVAITMCTDAAWAACTERWTRVDPRGGPVEVRHQSTNIFRRESGAWRLAHRQVAPVDRRQLMVGLSTQVDLSHA